MRSPRSSGAIPLSAAALGWAGVLPFLAGALAVVLRLAGSTPGELLAAYGTAILSFMGGVQWGVAMRVDETGWRGYAISVLPALLGWAALLMPRPVGLAVLAAGFCALLAYDLWTARRGEVPAWYARLRVQLTVAVVALLLIATVAS